MKTELEMLEELKAVTMKTVASKKKHSKTLERRSSMSMDSHSQKAIDNANASITWQAMELDKLKHELHAVSVDCGLSEPRSDYGLIWYEPSAFQKYKYQPRLPLCRQ